MSNLNNPHPGMPGGFARPEFTAGPGISGEGPRVEAHIASMDGTREEIVRREQTLHGEHLEGNRRRRYRFLIAAATAVAAMALIVALVLWFWIADPYSLGATGI
ncbi:hypothetical protein EAH68_03025 [Corynebacterium hylobatis]|uniref:Uncharacterized protein n=1 Tax=Corynebacterium hylobatis TaxID=1859290 RepID=A0A3S0A0X3_9CORY|nr:hypothetical protein [Corynebacterium hylobatis]RSZ65129.1 hypothetical protein EAH68_03025 [Corynebacterium hylobatis]